MSDKILIAARLSRVVRGKDQVSIERQDETARRYAKGSQAITAPDAGVSGSVSPFKRPKLGPYLTDPALIAQWDELVASALDRLGRNARDLAALRDWAEDHGKRLTILSPHLTWPPAPDDLASGLIWDVLGRLAEIELKLTTKRYADTRAYLRQQKSMIGKPCWGFRIVGTKGDKTIAPDQVKVPYLLRMIEMAEAGKSQTVIAEWLDAEGVKSRYGGPWSPRSVGQILRNESLHGVYRENGAVLLRHEGVISKERFDRLQAKLDSHPKRRGPTRNDPAMLTDSLYCSRCKRVMHARRVAGKIRKDGSRGPDWIGYRCDGLPRQPSTCRNMIPAADIESWVDAWFTIPADAGGSGFADVEIIETIVIPAKGHADEVAELDAEIDSLDKGDPGYLAEVTRLYAERERLVALGAEPARTEPNPTGVFIGDHWRTLDAAGKRSYLRRTGIRIFASKDDRWITGDPQRIIGALREALPAAA